MLTAISGQPLAADIEIGDAILNASRSRPEALFVDALRDGRRILLRWRISGDLLVALEVRGPARTRVVLPLPSGPANQVDFGIVKVDDLTYRIPRTIADQIVLDPAKTTGFQARTALDRSQPIGIMLGAVNPVSAYAQLGLQDGDILRAVNGLPLRSKDEALAAHARLGTANVLRFDLERRGKRVTLTITIE